MNRLVWSPKHAVKSKAWKGVTFTASSLVIVALILVIVFMMQRAYPASQAGNIVTDVIFGNNFDIAKGEFGLGISILMTLITTVFAILIAAPMAIKTACFIVFRLKNKTVKKILKAIVDLLAGIPSIIFGVFSLTSFGVAIGNIFGLTSSRNLVTATLTLVFMILPLITALTINSLESEKRKHWNGAIALGISTSQIIYKIIKPAAKKGISIGIIIGVTRALGESMAMSVILQGSGGVFSAAGPAAFFNNQTPTLASLTASNFLTNDASADLQPVIQGAFFSGGIAFFAIIFLINTFILGITKEYRWKRNLNQKIIDIKGSTLSTIINPKRLVKMNLKKGVKSYLPSDTYKGISMDLQIASFLDMVQKKETSKKAYTWYKRSMEVLVGLIVLFFIGWILVDTLVLKAIIFINQPGYVFLGIDGDNSGNTIGTTMASTMLLIVTVVILSFPIALLTALYMNEFAKKDSKIVTILKFFIDSLGAVPSIFFGIFGYVFFVQTLGIGNRVSDFIVLPSILAGGLTMLIVVLPTFIRALEGALLNVPRDYKHAAIALGVSKWKTISKIVIPAAIVGITTSVILTIGRILSETAPIYLTMGLSPNKPWEPNFGETLINPGQTLTTRIFQNINLASSEADFAISYEAGFFCVLLLILINSSSYFVSNYISKRSGVR